MNEELARVIDSVSKDKGIDKEIILEAVNESVVSAAHKLLKTDPSYKDLECQFNEYNDIELFEFKKVVDDVFDDDMEISLNEARELDPEIQIDEEIGIKLSPSYTRIAIQNARQKIIQKLKEAEAKVIFEEFKSRQGELVNGIVRRIARGSIIVDIGRTEAIIPYEEQVPREYFQPKDRLRAVLLKIEEDKRGTKLVISRSHRDFVESLFKSEVPEIGEGIVQIMGIARDPGGRTKISVSSNDSDIDPVGACVGMRGSRVQNIIQELKGEKIDIVPWSVDIARYACNSLSPARVNKVIMDEGSKAMEVIVDEDQFSLTIGRKGQNVRLASDLLGWEITIKTDTQLKEEQQNVVRLLLTLPKVSEVNANLLFAGGFHTLEDVAFGEMESLKNSSGINDNEDIERIQHAARTALQEKLRNISVDEESEEEETEDKL
ncbi:transcription termination/antitermination protein NusA [bacterium]|nr:transcription termination/antitermination protein NusA [bacterium]NSW99479.1 transcription termination/antitermination protein NusA [bacterium]|tara:strand:- start:8489 stop:9790 length:1302 start_codon:yes stop_codon:yes gene_type:complete